MAKQTSIKQSRRIRFYKKINLSILFLLLGLASYAQDDIIGNYKMQTAHDGKIENLGTIAIEKLDENTYDLVMTEIQIWKGKEFVPKPNHKKFTLNGKKLVFDEEIEKQGLISAEFKDDGSLLYLIGYGNRIYWIALATKVGNPRQNISKELAEMTNMKRKCPCCNKQYKKGEGFFMYAENKKALMYKEIQDLLYKSEGRYCCSELCAEKHYKGKCHK